MQSMPCRPVKSTKYRYGQITRDSGEHDPFFIEAKPPDGQVVISQIKTTRNGTQLIERKR